MKIDSTHANDLSPHAAGFCAALATYQGKELPFRLIGAHDALSARLGQDAGFDGIWASGLEISASHGVPDDGRLPLAEIMERVREMVRAVRIPILVDAESGFASVEETTETIEASGAAGLVLEDRLEPKINSLIQSDEHRLRGVSDFCRDLEMALRRRRRSDFAVIARIEALIAGAGMENAVARGAAYLNTGASGIIIHSNSAEGAPVCEFLARILHRNVPFGVIPTRYYRCSAAQLKLAGAEFVIYANHGVRAKTRALQRTFRQILETGSSESSESEIASVEELFRIQAEGGCERRSQSGVA